MCVLNLLFFILCVHLRQIVSLIEAESICSSYAVLFVSFLSVGFLVWRCLVGDRYARYARRAWTTITVSILCASRSTSIANPGTPTFSDPSPQMYGHRRRWCSWYNWGCYPLPSFTGYMCNRIHRDVLDNRAIEFIVTFWTNVHSNSSSRSGQPCNRIHRHVLDNRAI